MYIRSLAHHNFACSIVPWQGEVQSPCNGKTLDQKSRNEPHVLPDSLLKVMDTCCIHVAASCMMILLTCRFQGPFIKASSSSSAPSVDMLPRPRPAVAYRRPTPHNLLLATHTRCCHPPSCQQICCSPYCTRRTICRNAILHITS